MDVRHVVGEQFPAVEVVWVRADWRLGRSGRGCALVLVLRWEVERDA